MSHTRRQGDQEEEERAPPPRTGLASQRLAAELQDTETAILRRAHALETLLSELQLSGAAVALVAPPVANEEEPLVPEPVVNQREGWMELYLPVQGRRRLVRLNTLGMTDGALRAYMAIHRRLLGEQGGPSEARRRSFFAAVRYAPPSPPRVASQDARDPVQLGAAPSHGSSVEVVEIADSLALASTLNASSEHAALPGPGPLTAKGLRASRPASLRAAVPNAVTTIDDDGEDASTTNSGCSVTQPECTPPARAPPAGEGPLAKHSGASDGAGVGAHTLSQSGRGSRQGTPSRVRREMDELFLTPPPVKASAVLPRTGTIHPTTTTANKKAGAKRKRARSAKKDEPRDELKREEPTAANPHLAALGLGPGRDLLRMLYADSQDATTASGGASQGPPMALAPVGGPSRPRSPPPPPARDGPRGAAPSAAEGTGPVTHRCTLRQRGANHARYDEDEAYVMRTYGGLDGGGDDSDATAATTPVPAKRPRGRESTPRQFWDITFSYDSQPIQQPDGKK